MNAWQNVLVALMVCSLSACDADGNEVDRDDGGGQTASDDDGASVERDDAGPIADDDAGRLSGGDTPDAGMHDGASAQSDASLLPSRDAATSDAGSSAPAIFFLDIAGQRVLRADPNGRTSSALVTRGSASPDGIAVDPIKGFIYWTNMGVPEADDGFLMRATLSGANATTVVPKAATFTPKQLVLDAAGGFLYWSDREGMRVMRARTDGSDVQTLVTTGSGDSARADAANWAVGIAIDVPGDKLYWTQKGPDNGNKGSIRRAKLTPSAGQDSAHRADIEVLFAGLPEPVDLALNPDQGQIYWTDRGDNTVSRAPLEPPAGVAPDKRTDRSILVRNAGEAIGIALDVAHDALYYTSLEGSVFKAKLDGTGATAILKNQGSLTGIAYVELAR
jgi:DNA-binding beta-propeller fold protein YncE